MICIKSTFEELKLAFEEVVWGTESTQMTAPELKPSVVSFVSLKSFTKNCFSGHTFRGRFFVFCGEDGQHLHVFSPNIWQSLFGTKRQAHLPFASTNHRPCGDARGPAAPDLCGSVTAPRTPARTLMPLAPSSDRRRLSQALAASTAGVPGRL